MAGLSRLVAALLLVDQPGIIQLWFPGRTGERTVLQTLDDPICVCRDWPAGSAVPGASQAAPPIYKIRPPLRWHGLQGVPLKRLLVNAALAKFWSPINDLVTLAWHRGRLSADLAIVIRLGLWVTLPVDGRQTAQPTCS